MKYTLIVLLSLSLMACSDGEEGLKEQTEIQTIEEINAQNKNLKDWSEKLESDLRKRRAFVSAVEGEFQGTFVTEDSNYSLRILITPTLPYYETERTRTLEEIEYELQNLNLNLQVTQWVTETELTVGGCVFQEIRPDLNRGLLNLISEDCSNTYQLFLEDSLLSAKSLHQVDVLQNSNDLAKKIKDGLVERVDFLNGKIRSNNNWRVKEFWLERI